ncbi:peptidoglycan editing factor PgeF [Hydrogenimonas sp.]
MRASTLFTDRWGGCSAPPFHTFNLALHVGDDPKSVQHNRAALEKRVGTERIVWMEQVHGDTVRLVDEASPRTLPPCDAIVTDCRGIALGVLVADCVPLLLFDETRGVVAAVHAGRNGTFLQIASKSVAAMREAFGCDPADIAARMGPSIGPCCYEIGEDLVALVTKNFGEEYMNGRYLDLKRLNAHQLERSGIPPEKIDISPLCTRCSPDHFSYRKEERTGRFAGVVWLEA